MHELGLLTTVAEAVTQAADKAHAERVVGVGLRVGTLSGAVEEALHGSWPLASIGTPAEGATLEIEMIQAAVWCDSCQAEQPIDEFFALTCPVCGTPTANLVRGREFEVAWADLDGLPDGEGRD